MPFYLDALHPIEIEIGCTRKKRFVSRKTSSDAVLLFLDSSAGYFISFSVIISFREGAVGAEEKMQG